MSILDRIHTIATGTWGGLQAPFGFVKDVALAFPELGDADVTGFSGDVYHALVHRVGAVAEGTVGPQGMIGGTLGAIPDPLRVPFRAANSEMDQAYHELIGRPLATVLTADSISQAHHDMFGAGLLHLSQWSEAWRISDHRSPGQAFMLALTHKDIYDPKAIQQAQGTFAYTLGSGLFDAVTRTYLDPTQLALGGITEARNGIYAINSAQALKSAEAHGLLYKWLQGIQGMNAAEIRHTRLPKMIGGGEASSILADAASLPPTFTQGLQGIDLQHRVLRVMLGATDELQLLRDARPDIAGQLQRALTEESKLRQFSMAGELTLLDDPEGLAAAEQEVQALYHTQGQALRLEKLAGRMDDIRTPSKLAQWRARATLGDLYQHSPAAKPLRWIFDMEPHNYVRVDDPRSDQTVWRQLQKSNLSMDEQLHWRSEYLNAQTAEERTAVYNQAENRIVGQMASDAGMTRAEIDQVIEEAQKGRNGASKVLANRAYDGNGRSTISIESHDGILTKRKIIDYPIYETQTANLVPTVDLDEVRHALSPIRQHLQSVPGSGVAPELLDNFAHVWRPATLLRVGMPVRVNIDEFLRGASQIGALTMMRGSVRGALDAGAVTLKKAGIDLKRDLIGNEKIMAGGHTADGAFMAAGDMTHINRSMIGARESIGSLIDPTTEKIAQGVGHPGAWRHLDPVDDAKAYPAAFEHVGNHQIGQSLLGKKILEERITHPALEKTGATVTEAIEHDRTVVDNTVNWLQSTTEGQQIARAISKRRDGLRAWVQDVALPQIDSYLPTTEMQQAAHDGVLTHKMLEAAVKDPALRPLIHGGVIDEAMGVGKVGRMWRNIVERGMNGLISKPNDYLIRQPFYDHNYQAKLGQLVAMRTGERQLSMADRIAYKLRGLPTHSTGPGIELAHGEMESMQEVARQYAWEQTKNLMHDYGEHSRMAKMLGMWAPFYNAWSQVSGRWAGIAFKNPAYVRRLQLMWRSPEKAGLITDGSGNVLDSDGNIVTPAANSQFKVGDHAADDQRNLTFSVPHWAEDLPLVGAGLKATRDQVRVGKDSLNLLAEGLPTPGPIVQIAMNQIALDRPDLESSLKWALPFGASQNALAILEPTLLKREGRIAKAEADQGFARRALAIWADRMVEYRQGKLDKQPTYQDALHDAKAFENVRALSGFFLPTTPQYVSPYQMYIDALRDRRNLDATLTPEQKAAPDYQTPDEWFLSNFGDEFFPLVARLSKSIDGIAPTLQGAKTHGQFSDIISQYPFLGGPLTGQSGGSAFSRSVYESQFAQKIGGASSQQEREVVSPQEFQTQTSTELGWTRFGQMMDQIDSMLAQRGLTSLQQKGAEDLRNLKKIYVSYLANDPKYAGWFADYGNSDTSMWDNRIKGFESAITTHPEVLNRPDFEGLQKFLQARKQIVGIMQAAGASTLQSQQMAGLRGVWEAYVQQLVEGNPAFGALYNRWFANDPITITPVTEMPQGAVV